MLLKDQMSPMSSSVVTLFFSLNFLLLLSAAYGFNITQILSSYPDFTTFDNYLTRTGVAGEINNKQTVTVLVVANGNMSELSGLPTDAITKVMSVHVILDYIDVTKLQNLHNSSLTLTTLYQESGFARNQQGFLNVTHVGNGAVAFGSAASGSNLDSVLVKTVSAQPYNISVLQISNVINVASNSTTPFSPPAPTPAVSPNWPTHPPAASPPRKALAPAPSSEAAPAASPTNPSNEPAAADAPGSDNKSSAAPAPAPATSGNYLASILMIFTSAWFLLNMI